MNIRIEKEQCNIKNKFVYIPREVLVDALKKQVDTVKVEPEYLSREDVEKKYFPKMKKLGINPVEMISFVAKNHQKYKSDDGPRLTVYSKLLSDIISLTEKYGSNMVNQAFTAVKTPSTATIPYLKGIIRNISNCQA